MKYWTIILFMILNILLYFNSALEALEIDFFKELFLLLIMVTILLIVGIFNKKVMLAFVALYTLLYILNNLILMKLITFLLLFYIAYNIVMHYYTSIRKMLIIILVLNVIFLFIELNGFVDGLDKFQIYYDSVGYQKSFFVENSWFPLYQIRPSGIYHSTIFLSFEMIFTIAILFYGIKSYTLVFVITFLSVFSGSTALFLLLMIIPLVLYISKVNNLKITLATYSSLIFWLVVYMYMYPSIASYNFNFENYLASFDTRLDFSNTHSTITANIKLIVTILIIIFWLVIFYLIKNNYKLNMRFIYLFIILASVFLIHDFVNTSKFYINIGLLFGYIKIYYLHKNYNLANKKDTYCRT